MEKIAVSFAGLVVGAVLLAVNRSFAAGLVEVSRANPSLAAARIWVVFIGTVFVAAGAVGVIHNA
jgi:hypothetical protein